MDKDYKPLVSSKTSDESCQAEIWVVPDYKPEKDKNEDSKSVVLEQRITDLKMKIESLDESIDRLENSADGIDFAVAAACGIVAGVLDVLFVEEFSMEKASAWGTETANSFLYRFAAKEGYLGQASTDGAATFLSSKYESSGNLAHSPSLLGLVLSICTAVGGVVLGTGKTGYSFTTGNSAASGSLADAIFRGVADWGVHAVCGISSGTGAKKNGLPGPMNTLLKKSASINTLDVSGARNEAKLSAYLDQTLSGKTKNVPGFNLQTELGVAAQIGAQAIPVLINEAVVRAFYFIRRFFMEVSLCGVKSVHDLYKVDWKSTLPFGNRTIARMMSVASLAMTTVDMAGAAIEAAAQAGGQAALFFSGFALRLNYVGLGRTVIAITADGIMGGKLSYKRKERIALVAEYLELSKEKIYYKQKDMWVTAENTRQVIDEAVAAMAKTDEILKEAIEENKQSFTRIQVSMDKAEEKNPGLKDAIKDTIKWE